MTPEKAIERLEVMRDCYEMYFGSNDKAVGFEAKYAENREAFNMAVEALRALRCDVKGQLSIGSYIPMVKISDVKSIEIEVPEVKKVYSRVSYEAGFKQMQTTFIEKLNELPVYSIPGGEL